MKRLLALGVAAVLLCGCTPAEYFVALDRLDQQMVSIEADLMTLAADRWNAYESRKAAELNAAMDRTLTELASAGLLTPQNARKAFGVYDSKRAALEAVKGRFWAAVGNMAQKPRTASGLLKRLAAWQHDRDRLLTSTGPPLLELARGLLPEQYDPALEQVGAILAPTTQPEGD